MIILFLDLASHDGLIALCDEHAVCAHVSADHRIADHELVPLIEGVLKDAGVEYSALDRIACVVGPGGFTSLRVAVSCANALAHELKIPSAGIHLSDLYAARIVGSGKSEVGSFLWLHSTKRTQLFVRGFGEYVKQFPETVCMELDTFFSLLSSTPLLRSTPPPVEEGLGVEEFLWVGELLPEHEKVLLEKGASRAQLQSVSEVLPAFLNSQTYSENLLEPWYGRGY